VNSGLWSALRRVMPDITAITVRLASAALAATDRGLLERLNQAYKIAFDHVSIRETSRPNVYKLEKVFEVKKEFRLRSVTLCDVPTIAGLEQT
jgi:hypothetical protein